MEWLATKDINPHKWVASMIGYTESAIAQEAILLIILGISGLIGLFIATPIFEFGNRILGKRNKGVKPDLEKETDRIISLNCRQIWSISHLERRDETRLSTFAIKGYSSSHGINGNDDYVDKRMKAGCVCLCEITNHSDEPLFNIHIPISIRFYKDDISTLVQPDAQTNHSVGFPGSTTILKGEKLSVLFVNTSDHGALLEFTGELIVADGNKHIALAYSFETSFSRQLILSGWTENVTG